MFAKSLILAGLFASAAVNALPQYGNSGSQSGCSSGDCGSSSSSGYGSSSSNSGYSSSNSNSGYSGSSSSNYGSSSDSGCSSGDCGSSSNHGSSSSDMSTMTMDSGCGSSGCGENTSMVESTSTMMSEMTSSTMMVESTSTSTTSMSYSTPSYGSGGMSWSNSGYDGCVQQCVAQFGTPGSYQPTVTSGSSGSSGSGSTITVIVAPTQGVLRYVPFAVNASVGDTIKFMWGANNHTVTKSSELTPCNKTQDAPFASGTQNQSFVFTQVVNDTNPTFFYCGTPTHCEKGMFGIINPPSALDAPTSVAGMMSSVMANDSTGNIATYASYTANQTAGSAGANWGANIDMSNMPSWAYESVVENVMFTRNVLAMNPDLMNADGSVNLNSVSSTPMMVPPDVGSALSASTSTGSSSSSPASSGSSSAASSSSSPVGASSNGAMSVASSKVLIGATVLVATFFAL